MFERQRESKKKESVADKNPKEQSGLSRRQLLGAIGAIAATTAAEALILPIVVKSEKEAEAERIAEVEKLERRRHEWLYGNGVEMYKNFVRSTEGQRILHEGTDAELTDLICDRPFSVTPDQLKETRFDPDKAFPVYPALQLVVRDQFLGAVPYNRFEIGRATTDYSRGAYDRQSFGNCVAVTDDLLLTAKHVAAAGDTSLEIVRPNAPDYLDIALVRIPVDYPKEKRPAPEEIISLPQGEHDEDVSGRMVVCMGVHPSGESDWEHRKYYIHNAIPVTDRVIEWADRYLKKTEKSPSIEESWKRLNRERSKHSFLMLVPPGEIKSGWSGRRDMMGMSGAPVFAVYENGDAVEYKLSGLLWGGGLIEIAGREFGVALCHGIDEIRTAMPEEVQRQLERR